MIKKYARMYLNILLIITISSFIFSLLAILLMLILNTTWPLIFILPATASAFALIPVPYIIQKHVTKKIFLQSSKVEIEINRLAMENNLEMLSKTEETFIELSKDNQKKFYLLKVEVPSNRYHFKGYKLIILCEHVSFVLCNSSINPFYEWILHFNKFYTIIK